MIKRVWKTVAGVFVVLLIVVLLLGWWFLSADKMRAPELPGRLDAGTIEHQGHTRSWSAYVPASLAPRSAVVLVLHGSLGDGAQMRKATRYSFDVAAERRGFIAVYPDGFERHWNDCRGSANYSANLRDIDDEGFFRALLAELNDKYEIDFSGVYATGFSNGGQMAYRLALEAPDLVAGIASVSANLPVAENLDCEPSGQPVAALVINGTADPINPYAGGLVEMAGDASRGLVLSTEETAAYWAGLAGYSEAGEQRSWPDANTDDGTTIDSIEWSSAGRVPVAAISIEGGGHTWPHPLFRLPRILGPTSHEFDAAELIWSFFSGSGEPLAPGVLQRSAN